MGRGIKEKLISQWLRANNDNWWPPDTGHSRETGAMEDADIKDEWHYPSNLEKSEAEQHGNRKIEHLDLKNDFDSYRRILLTGEFTDSLIELHNDMNPRQKIIDLVKCLRLKDVGSVLDIGCGVGITSTAIAEVFPHATVLGVDASRDAITFAETKASNVRFKHVVLAPGFWPLETFDLIFCIEFYPFTRNANVSYQAEFIRMLSSGLRENGKLVIYQKWDNPASLSAVLSQVTALLPELDLEVFTFPNPRFSRVMPLPWPQWQQKLQVSFFHAL